jgi:hypothetical protein
MLHRVPGAQRLEGEAGGASEDTPPAAAAHLLGDLHERR